MLYAITYRRLYTDKKADAQACLVELAATWAANGVSYIQLREKDLTAREQVELTRAVIRAVRQVSGKSSAPGVLVNGRADVALAADADGVHLPSGPDALTPEEVRGVYAAAGHSRPLISVSCHAMEEVSLAREQSPDCILFAPVFEKTIRETNTALDAAPSRCGTTKLAGTGLVSLESACLMAGPVPVFALGGVTAQNAVDCLRAGAAGIAAIRLMAQPPSVWKYLA